MRRALVELVVIVAGVLIALSADQWLSSREDDRTEAAYLSRMMDDISAALEELHTRRGQAQNYLASSAELSKLPRGGMPVSADSLATLVGEALFNLVQWDSRIFTLEDLKNTGRMSLISDLEIRRGLAEIDRLSAAIRAAEDDLLQTQHHTLDPFLIRTSDLPRVVPTTLPSAAAYLGPPIGSRQSAVLSDPELQNVVALRIVLLMNLEEAYADMEEHLGDLSEMIEGRSR